MLFKIKPATFTNTFDIVACFCVQKNKMLFLHRQKNKPQGSTWGIPAGKVNAKESPLNAIERELQEETGITVPPQDFTYIDKVYTRYPEYDFTFYMYKTKIKDDVKITLNSTEHTDFVWIELTNLSTLNLMQDIEECVKKYYH